MSKAEVTTLIEDTRRQLARYLEELAAGRSFDMNGFESIVRRIQQEIGALPPVEAAGFKKDIDLLMNMLDGLQHGLEEKRDSVRREIEGLNRQIEANKAYRKPDSN